jgi:hypothetical protein
MNKKFIGVFLLALILAVVAGLFASSKPDGLEKVAQSMRFESKAVPSTAPFTDYLVKGITNPSASTVVAGIVGILLIFFTFKSISRSRHIGELIKNLFKIE